MVDNFEMINFEHLHHEENQMADALATLAAIKEELAHCSHIEEEVDGKSWYYDVL